MTPEQLDIIRDRDAARRADCAVFDRRDLLAHVDQLRAVVAAADAYFKNGHPPISGACAIDHYHGKECDCGFEAYRAARKQLEGI